MDISERIAAFERRLEDEGLYTDSNIVWAANEEIKHLNKRIEVLAEIASKAVETACKAEEILTKYTKAVNKALTGKEE